MGKRIKKSNSLDAITGAAKMNAEEFLLEQELLQERTKILYDLHKINKKIRNIRLPEQIANLYTQGWKIADIAKEMKVSEVTVRNWLRKKGKDLYKPRPPKGNLTESERENRGLKIYIDKTQHKKTFVQIAKELGLSAGYVSGLFAGAERKIKRDRSREEARKQRGIIIDPDGIGEYQQTYTAEDQYKEIENER
jgi:AraC-like DNA-binding protein